jgi:hypothetical protein
METILNDKSKLYERITLDTLIAFIKTNLSSLQPVSEIIMVEQEKKVPVKTENKVKKINTFYEELAENSNPINFCNNFTKNFPNFPESNLLITNLNSLFIPEESEGKKKKVDYSKYTFFKAILYNLIKKITETELETFIKTLVKHVSYGGITEFNYTKLKWNKKMLKDNINDNIINEMTIRVICDYLHINIFVLNDDSKKIEYGGGEFVPFKKNIFVYKYDNNYYPIFTKKDKFFQFNSDLMKYILKNTDILTLLSHDQFSYKEEDLSKYIDISKILPEISLPSNNLPIHEEISIINKFDDDYSDSDEEEESEEDQKEEDEEDEDESEEDQKEEEEEEETEEDYDQVIFDKYMKLSLMEIQKEAKKYNIQIKNGMKLKNKKELCMEISKVKKNS